MNKIMKWWLVLLVVFLTFIILPMISHHEKSDFIGNLLINDIILVISGLVYLILTYYMHFHAIKNKNRLYYIIFIIPPGIIAILTYLSIIPIEFGQNFVPIAFCFMVLGFKYPIKNNK